MTKHLNCEETSCIEVWKQVDADEKFYTEEAYVHCNTEGCHKIFLKIDGKECSKCLEYLCEECYRVKHVGKWISRRQYACSKHQN